MQFKFAWTIRFKPVLVVLGWATSMAAIALAAIFQGLLIPSSRGLRAEIGLPLGVIAFYIGILAICIIASMTLADLVTSVLCFFPSYLGAIVLTFLVLSSPDYLGGAPFELQGPAVEFAAVAFFPIALLVGFFATAIGAALAERYL